MKLTINKVFALLLLPVFAACTANYENINTNPYQPGDLNADDYGLGSAMNALAGCVVSSDVNTAQFTECLLGGTQGGYFADANAGFQNTISNFNAKDDWTRVFLKSDQIIPVLYANLNAIKNFSETGGNPVPYAIAQVIKVAAMHRVADTFGPIPYSKIGADGKITTPYDSEKDIYNKFFEELNESIEILTEHQNDALTATADYVYGGNVKKWIRFANSLKLRLAMRIVYADPVTAQAMAESAVNHEIGVITSNDDIAAWRYFGGSTTNPLNVAVNYNRLDSHADDDAKCTSTGDSHAAADIICYMNGYNDPRREKYFTPSEWEGTDYVGMRRGIVIPEHATTGHRYSGPNITSTDPLYWMNAAEVAFLRAEAVAVFGFNMGGTAQEFYNEGVRLSFAQWGVEGVEDYLADQTSVPELYEDPAGRDSYGSQLSTVTPMWNEGASVEEKQERIMIQKWIANWQIGNEAWADYRRTGYPTMIPVSNNKSQGIVDSKLGARRMPYPLDEFVSNADNVAYAVANYLNGPDNMATDLWWACK